MKEVFMQDIMAAYEENRANDEDQFKLENGYV